MLKLRILMLILCHFLSPIHIHISFFFFTVLSDGTVSLTGPPATVLPLIEGNEPRPRRLSGSHKKVKEREREKEGNKLDIVRNTNVFFNVYML